ncbi:MAG TPA: hypothetical protein VNB50_08610 [Gaiellaceae bacterium]|nr:hypothetical protein [Gaiellaceae bacterium]
MLCGLATVAVFETYWRFPPQDLWKVTHTGLVGGAGRAFVFLSYSPALAAIPVLLIVADRLDNRRTRLLALVSLVLCATVAIPGVQTPSQLDPRWAYLPAVIGVGLAVGLTAWASAHGRPEAVRTTTAGDLARVSVGAVSLFFAAPYIAAELGFFLDGVPLLGWIFQTGAMRPEPGAGYLHAAVHHGHHHGLDGFLLAVTALLLSRLLGGIRAPGLRTATALVLSLMLVYGLTNEAQDQWVEQIVKRGWTDWEIPNVMIPSLSLAWAAMLACAALVYVAFLRCEPLVARR